MTFLYNKLFSSLDCSFIWERHGKIFCSRFLSFPQTCSNIFEIKKNPVNCQLEQAAVNLNIVTEKKGK